MLLSDEQLLNIASIIVTFEVSNFERSRDSNDEQPENMCHIFVTESVFRAAGNTMLSKDEQSENMLPISVTLEVSKFDISKTLRDEQPENMELISSTVSVLKFFGKEREVSDEQPENMKLMFVTLEASNFERSRDSRDEQLRNIQIATSRLEV